MSEPFKLCTSHWGYVDPEGGGYYLSPTGRKRWRCAKCLNRKITPRATHPEIKPKYIDYIAKTYG